MATEGIEAQFIEAIRAALVAGGYTVYDNILDHHTGQRTKSSTYMQIARSWQRTSDEITIDCIQGDYSYSIRYHQASPLIVNTAGEALEFTDMCQQVEKSISQVKTSGLFTRPNMQMEETTTSSLRGLVRDWTLSGTVASRQDRAEVAGPPINTSLPVISGLQFAGQTLTATTGSWIGSVPITYAYDWQANGVTLGAADQNTYVVGSGLEGDSITCVITATNSFDSTDATSNAIVIDTAAAPVNTVAPVVTPNPPTEEDLLTTTDGTWTGNPAPTFTYQWYKDTVLIGAATSVTYQLVVGDADSVFFCRVTGTNIDSAVSADSNNVTATSIGIEEYPSSPTLAWFTDIAFNADLESDILTERRDTDNNSRTIGNTGSPNYLFDTADWSDHTSAGANPAYASTLITQKGSNFTQTTTSNQPLVNSNGSITCDGVNHTIDSITPLVDGDNFSFGVILEKGAAVANSYIASQATPAARSWKMQVFSTTGFQFEAFSSTSGNPWRFAVPAYFLGTKLYCLVTYESTVGAKMYINGVLASILRVGQKGIVDTGLGGVFLGSLAGGAKGDDTFSGVEFYDGETLTQTQVTDNYDWLVDRGILP